MPVFTLQITGKKIPIGKKPVNPDTHKHTYVHSDTYTHTHAHPYTPINIHAKTQRDPSVLIA